MREGRASARDAARARIAEQEVVVGAHGQGVGAALLVSALRHGISPPANIYKQWLFLRDTDRTARVSRRYEQNRPRTWFEGRGSS